jgi:transglutaminase-like putative cysteine protease
MRTSVNDPATRNIDRKRITAIEKGWDGDYNLRPMRAMKGAVRRHRSHIFVLAFGVVLSTSLGGCLSPTGNRPPVADFDVSPREGYAPLSVLLDATGTFDPDGDAISYEWSFGNGEEAEGRTIVHSFPEGTHTVTLRATDARGGIGTASETVIARPVPDGYVVLRYEWLHEGETQQWNALLPYSLYQTYRGRLRISFGDRYDYPAYVLDPLDDPTLEELADVLWNLAGGRSEAFIEWTLSFVQGAIRYLEDPPDNEWPLYPIETLYDKAGDCEDTAILFVSLLRAKGMASTLATVDTDGDGNPDHVLVFVPVSAAYAAELSCSAGVSLTIMTLDGGLHAVAETAVESGILGIGCDPWHLEAEDVIESWAF